MRVLLEHGADVVDAKTEYLGGTALNRAAEKGHEPVVRVLTTGAPGADVDAEAEQGRAVIFTGKHPPSYLPRMTRECGILFGGADVRYSPVFYCTNIHKYNTIQTQRANAPWLALVKLWLRLLVARETCFEERWC